MIRGANSQEEEPSGKAEGGDFLAKLEDFYNDPEALPDSEAESFRSTVLDPEFYISASPERVAEELRSFRGGSLRTSPLSALCTTPRGKSGVFGVRPNRPLFWTFPTPTAPLPAKPKRERGPRALRKSPRLRRRRRRERRGERRRGRIRRGVPGDAARRGDCPFGSPVRSRQALVRGGPRRPSPDTGPAPESRAPDTPGLAPSARISRGARKDRGVSGFVAGGRGLPEPSRSHRGATAERQVILGRKAGPLEELAAAFLGSAHPLGQLRRRWSVS